MLKIVNNIKFTEIRVLRNFLYMRERIMRASIHVN